MVQFVTPTILVPTICFSSSRRQSFHRDQIEQSRDWELAWASDWAYPSCLCVVSALIGGGDAADIQQKGGTVNMDSEQIYGKPSWRMEVESKVLSCRICRGNAIVNISRREQEILI
jgi:hypothetical protein